MASKGRLTAKQFAFCEAYLETLNATEAAQRAGYQAKDNGTLRSIGSENLTKPNIKAYIEARLQELTMPADEVLLRLTQQARGIDSTSFVEIEQLYTVIDDIPLLTGQAMRIDLAKIRELGLGHLIKKISQNTSGGMTIEWHNPQKALELLGRYHRLFTDKVEVDLSDEMKEHISHFNNLKDKIYGDG